MQTFIDDRPIDTPGHTLADAIGAATEHAGNRLIISAVADGAPVPDEHFTEPPTNAPYCQELRFTTADRASLVRVTLAEAADALDNLAEAHTDAARHFHTGDNNAALAKLQDILSAWQNTENAINTCRAVEGVSCASPEHDRQIQAASNDLTNTLNEIKSAIVARDLTTAADAIEFDLAEQTETWADLLRALADHTTESAPA
jgi:hypothetical protein